MTINTSFLPLQGRYCVYSTHSLGVARRPHPLTLRAPVMWQSPPLPGCYSHTTHIPHSTPHYAHANTGEKSKWVKKTGFQISTNVITVDWKLFLSVNLPSSSTSCSKSGISLDVDLQEGTSKRSHLLFPYHQTTGSSWPSLLQVRPGAVVNLHAYQTIPWLIVNVLCVAASDNGASKKTIPSFCTVKWTNNLHPIPCIDQKVNDASCDLPRKT